MVPWQLAGLILGSTPQERIVPGLQVTVIGMSVVFAVLILLYFILTLVGRLGEAGPAAGPGGAGTGQTAQTVESQIQAPAVDASVVQASSRSAISEQAAEPGSVPDMTEELVAAIAAALAVATTGERSGSTELAPLRTRGVPSAWTLAGRVELQTSREHLARG